jgi:hypothetical protein
MTSLVWIGNLDLVDSEAKFRAREEARVVRNEIKRVQFHPRNVGLGARPATDGVSGRREWRPRPGYCQHR